MCTATALGQRLRQLRGDRRGGMAVGFAVLAPLLFLLTIGLVDLGRLFFAWSTLDHAIRVAARYAGVHASAIAEPAGVDVEAIKRFAAARAVGVDVDKVSFDVEFTPNRDAGSRVAVSAVYRYRPLLGAMLDVAPIEFDLSANATVQ
jgi:Flp pilus assembly protein TadG